MENFEEHIRHILLYYFKKGKKATEAREELRQVYGRNVIEKRQCQNWFARFRGGDFSVKDAHRSGRPSEIDDDKIKALVQANKHSTVRELATALKVSIGSVHGHLKSLGFVKKLNVWVPHQLKEIHLTKRMNVCDQLTKHEENDPFLKRMITGDEKWIVYNNVSRKRS
ncbi:histone-lysine N-methyltransferase SETMAR-like [Camponotus floridanus]|uniref:histone-lysine N-methyltransferase SETMAR-like n=1 Tax=Camponotus floridanus TaxID=104421 RepID=UPI000DC68820|nr:histone-lysine N-methyltransferase SETMAR-like [Camponotus floridanus]